MHVVGIDTAVEVVAQTQVVAKLMDGYMGHNLFDDSFLVFMIRLPSMTTVVLDTQRRAPLPMAPMASISLKT